MDEDFSGPKVSQKSSMKRSSAMLLSFPVGMVSGVIRWSLLSQAFFWSSFSLSNKCFIWFLSFVLLYLNPSTYSVLFLYFFSFCWFFVVRLELSIAAADSLMQPGGAWRALLGGMKKTPKALGILCWAFGVVVMGGFWFKTQWAVRMTMEKPPAGTV